MELRVRVFLKSGSHFEFSCKGFDVHVDDKFGYITAYSVDSPNVSRGAPVYIDVDEAAAVVVKEALAPPYDPAISRRVK